VIRLLEASERDAARAAAKECLARWPDSRAARDVLSRIEESERQEAIRARLGEARKAQREGDYEQALAHYHEAQGLGCPPEELGDGFEAAQAQVRRHREEAEAARIRSLLEQEDPSEGLLAYLQAPPPLREGLRAWAARPELDWLEALSPPASGAKARAAVEAVQALAQARQALAEGAEDHAQSLLAGHRKALEGLAPAQEAWEAIDRRHAAAQHEETAAHLAHAREAAREGHVDAALAALDRVQVRLLDDAQHQEAEALLVDLRRTEHRRLLRERADDLLAQGDALGARAALDELSQLAGEAEAQRLRAEHDALDERVRREWTVPVALEPDAEHILASLPMPRYRDATNPWLASRDGHLVIARPAQGRLLIATLDAAAGHVVDHALLRPPEALSEPLDWVVHGQRVSVIDRAGHLITLSLDGWRIEAWEPLARFMAADERKERVHHLPGTRSCWLESSRWEEDGLRFKIRVLDLEQHRVQRVLPEAVQSVLDIQGAPDEYVLVHGPPQEASRYASTGKHLARLPGLDGQVVHSATALPEREGTLALSYEAEVSVDPELVVSLLTADGRVSSAHPVPGSCGEMLNAFAVRRAPTLAFVLYQGFEDDHTTSRLLALEVRADGLARRYDVPAPPGALLLADTDQRRVTLLWHQPAGGVRALALEGQPPALPEPLADDAALRIPAFDPPFWCAPLIPESATETGLAMGADGCEEDDSPESAQPMSRGFHPERMIGVIETLLDEGHDRTVGELAKQALEEGDPGPAMTYVEWLFDRRAWDDVCELLEPLLAGALKDRHHYARHLYHLVGLAHYRAGRIERAAEVWRNGLELDGTCPLAALLEVADYVLRGERDASAGEGQLVTRLLAGIHLADRLLAQGDPASAADALDTPDVWAAGELQGFARLSLAWLQRDAAGPRADAIRLLVAGRYLEELRRERIGPPNDLHFPAAWDAERLEEVGRMAEAWLEELGRRGA
jgi:hypothetical protein